MGAVTISKLSILLALMLILSVPTVLKRCWHCGDLVFFFFFNFSSSHLVLVKWFSFSIQLYSLQISVFLAT